VTLQDIVWTIALVGMGLVALGFVHVIIQAGKPADEDATRKSAHTARALQAWLFAILFVGFVVGSWATLHNFPIPPQHSALDAGQVVDVVGRQWSWQITPATVMTGSEVEFRVTSADVNHGFAIYSPEGRIVTQVQAMPGYTNKLLYTFHEPGTYTVQCLEYCGLGHAPMRTTLEVVAPKGE
jgi:cytochrome c oxidase subunit 2